MSHEIKAPVPPFTAETAMQKVRMAEDAWNSRDPGRIVKVYTPDTVWRTAPSSRPDAMRSEPF